MEKPRIRYALVATVASFGLLVACSDGDEAETTVEQTQQAEPPASVTDSAPVVPGDSATEPRPGVAPDTSLSAPGTGSAQPGPDSGTTGTSSGSMSSGTDSGTDAPSTGAGSGTGSTGTGSTGTGSTGTGSTGTGS